MNRTELVGTRRMASTGVRRGWPILVAAMVPATALFAQSPQIDAASPPPSAILAETPSVTVDEAVAALGEAPLSRLLDILGPEVRAYNDHITTLGNPFFEGREPGARGGVLAAEYIEWQLRQLGLEPAFSTSSKAADGTDVITPNASFRQAVPFGDRLRVAAGRLEAGGDQGRVDLRRGIDFVVMSRSGSGSASGPLAFVGYSTENPAEGYASYPEGTDLTGKVALMLRFEPMTAEGRSKWIERGWSFGAAIDGKLRRAADLGAAAIIMVTPKGADDERVDELDDGDGQRAGRDALPIPVVMVTPAAADRLLSAVGSAEGLDALRRRADAAGFVEDLGGAVTVAAEVQRDPVKTDNVGAVLRGRGALADEYIVIGAHYDHVGYGYTGTASEGRLHPGADDNASGTSGLLLAAQKLAAAYRQESSAAPARSVIFLAFTAEEAGLIGSRYYANNPSVPLGSIAFMLNMDMIGRYRESVGLELGGVETAAGLGDWVAPVAAAWGFQTKPSTAGGRSDHASFQAKQIPVLFAFTGFHDVYHTPDDLTPTINRVGAVRVVGFMCDLALGVARRPDRFVFTSGQARRPDPPAEQPAAPPAGGPGLATIKVRFGIQPGDYTEGQKGVLIGAVTEGGTAALAGLLAGDRMTKWNGEELGDVADWMGKLRDHNPGDVVEITFERGGQTMRCHAVLQARPTSGG